MFNLLRVAWHCHLFLVTKVKEFDAISLHSILVIKKPLLFTQQGFLFLRAAFTQNDCLGDLPHQ